MLLVGNTQLFEVIDRALPGKANGYPVIARLMDQDVLNLLKHVEVKLLGNNTYLLFRQ